MLHAVLLFYMLKACCSWEGLLLLKSLKGAHGAQIDKCFGFDTAVEESQRALMAGKVEATSAYKGIGLVKLMGRQSGFIAMQASMASGIPDLLQSICNLTCACCLSTPDLMDTARRCCGCMPDPRGALCVAWSERPLRVLGQGAREPGPCGGLPC